MAAKEPTYQEEEEHNRRVFMESLKRVDPNLYVLKDMLDKTGLNPYVLLQVMRKLYSLMMGDRWGTLKVILQAGVVKYIEAIDITKVEEPLIKGQPIDSP